MGERERGEREEGRREKRRRREEKREGGERREEKRDRERKKERGEEQSEKKKRGGESFSDCVLFLLFFPAHDALALSAQAMTLCISSLDFFTSHLARSDGC